MLILEIAAGILLAGLIGVVLFKLLEWFKSGTIHLLLAKILWWFRKRLDHNKRLTEDEAKEIVSYYDKSMNMFRVLQIKVNSKPDETKKLYLMMLMYLDNEEVICPAAARTATLMGFLDSLNHGWVLPPTSTVVSKEVAEQVDDYLGMEIWRNHLGMKDIRDEISDAIAKFKPFSTTVAESKE